MMNPHKVSKDLNQQQMDMAANLQFLKWPTDKIKNSEIFPSNTITIHFSLLENPSSNLPQGNKDS